MPGVPDSAGQGDELVLPAVPSSVTPLRHHVVAFATASHASADLVSAMALAVTEVAGNVVMHAYRGREPGPVRVRCRAQDGRLTVEVADDGAGMAARDDSPGLGHGLATVGALVRMLEIEPGPGGRGTVVRMDFAPAGPALEAPDLEPLCALALELVADVCCVDVVGEGVLRRAAAEVADDPALSSWLRTSTPPTKPGTATWAALREGGARLVVHDPDVPRSPGGPGERLDLTWWIALPLEGTDGTPAAMWGMGGRAGGRPVPSAAVLDALTHAAAGDLADRAQREQLQERLRETMG